MKTTNVRPSDLNQMRFYSQGMADAIQAAVYIQYNKDEGYYQTVTIDSIDPKAETVERITPNKDIEKCTK